MSSFRSFADVPYPYVERWLDYRDCHVCYIDEGKGRPVVFLPALGRGLTHYEPNYPGLVAANRVVGVDLPGWGKSDKPDLAYEVAYYLNFLMAFVNELALGAPVFVGASGGGVLAAKYALQAPVAGLVLVGVAGMRRNFFTRRVLEKAFDEEGLKRIEEKTWRETVRRYFATDHPQAQIIADRGLALAKTPEWPLYARALSRAGRAMMAVDLEPELARLHVPTLVVWGERDEACPLSWGKKVAARIPGARLEVIPATGHFVNLEAPEAFNEAVSKFVGQL